jgi:hypothetical protein
MESATTRDLFENDPTALFLKAVNSQTEEIVAIARWHFYNDGYNIIIGILRKS